MTDSIWNELRYFSRREFDHPDKMDERFLLRLDALRDLCGFPLIVTSDHRPGAVVQETGNPSPHAEDPCCAVDLAPMGGLTSHSRYSLVSAAVYMSFPRIGIYDRHVHIDQARGDFPPDVMWLGASS